MTALTRGRVVAGFMAVLVVADILLIGWSLVERQTLWSARNHMTRGATFCPPVLLTGFDRTGAKVDLQGRSGLAIWYGSSACPFCRKDGRWSTLAERLRLKGVQVVIVLPNAREAFNDDEVVPRGAPQMAFVNVEWQRQYRLTATPTLLIFDANGGFVWHREGQLSSADVRAAMDAVDEASKRRQSSCAVTL